MDKGDRDGDEDFDEASDLPQNHPKIDKNAEKGFNFLRPTAPKRQKRDRDEDFVEASDLPQNRPKTDKTAEKGQTTSDRIYSKEFINWTKGTVGLQITKEGLCDFVKLEMEKFIVQLQTDDDHFTRFLESIIDTGQVMCRHKTKKGSDVEWIYISSCNSKWCKVCSVMFDALLEKHARKRSRNINWKCHYTSKKITPLIRWWVVAKMFIPDNSEKIKHSTGPAEVDALSLLSLLANCELFENIKHLALDVIEQRNKLMHSTTGKISETELTDAFNKMKALLGEKYVKETSHKQLGDLKKLEQTNMYLLKAHEGDHEIIRKALKLKKKSIEYDITEHKNDDIPSTELEELLKETEQEINIEKEHRKQDYICKKEEIRKQKEKLEYQNAMIHRQFERIHQLEQQHELLKTATM